MNERPRKEPNTLGTVSLILGILSLFFVFTIGVCAGVGKEQGWLKVIGALLFIIGAGSAFLGLMGGLLGFFGLFGRNKPKAAAFFGMLFGVGSVFLFFAVLKAVQN